LAQIFLSYAREDEAQVRGIYCRLIDAGFEVWMDKIDLLPGQRWQQEIPRAIRRADFILIFFSTNSVAKRGYVQREFRLALDTLEEMPPDAIHTIPIRLDDCQIPEQFHHLQWSDISEEGEFDRIVRALRFGMGQRQPFTPEPALEPPPDQRSKAWTNSIGIEFVLIPAGTFMMGSPDSDPEARDNEKPAHQVTLSQAFYLGKYTVTQAQWEAVMGTNPSELKGADRPIENVSWDDAQAFMQKLNEREGVDHYRLPTEAQWEYACRAGSSTRYHFGDDTARLSEYAWYDENSDNPPTHPVGHKQPNTWGLYDMHGDVWEWVQDWYGGYTAEPVTDPIGPTTSFSRIIRGGSWYGSAQHARSASRLRTSPSDRSAFIGFRCLSSGREPRSGA
jgi:formylglycine-generating enzyme required for sulfatase activity